MVMEVLVAGRAKPAVLAAIDRLGVPVRMTALSEDATALEPGPAALTALAAIVRDRRVDAVVATSESTMAVAGFVRSALGLPGLGYETSTLVTNKLRMRRHLHGAVRQPRCWLPGEFAQAADRPAGRVIVKPVSSSSSRGVQFVDAPGVARWLSAQKGLWIVEDVVDVKREFHADGIVLDGSVAWFEPSEYDRPVLHAATGQRSTSVLPPCDTLRDAIGAMARAVVARLGIADGVFHMEALHDGNELYFGEVALRPAGSAIPDALRLGTGADLWRAFMASQLGLPMTVDATRACKPTTGLIMARSDHEGRRPIDRDAAARLPGVIGTAPGTLEAGVVPTDISQHEYFVFFEGLDRDAVDDLRRRVAGHPERRAAQRDGG